MNKHSFQLAQDGANT